MSISAWKSFNFRSLTAIQRCNRYRAKVYYAVIFVYREQVFGNDSWLPQSVRTIVYSHYCCWPQAPGRRPTRLLPAGSVHSITLKSTNTHKTNQKNTLTKQIFGIYNGHSSAAFWYCCFLCVSAFSDACISSQPASTHSTTVSDWMPTNQPFFTPSQPTNLWHQHYFGQKGQLKIIYFVYLNFDRAMCK